MIAIRVPETALSAAHRTETVIKGPSNGVIPPSPGSPGRPPLAFASGAVA